MLIMNFCCSNLPQGIGLKLGLEAVFVFEFEFVFGWLFGFMWVTIITLVCTSVTTPSL